jgi:two-component system sensor histidine kinase/response regulator
MMREDLFDELDEHGIDMGIGKPITPSVLLNGIQDLFNLKAVSRSQPSASREPGLSQTRKAISYFAGRR